MRFDRLSLLPLAACLAAQLSCGGSAAGPTGSVPTPLPPTPTPTATPDPSIPPEGSGCGETEVDK